MSTCTSISAQIRDTVDFDTPVSQPNALTRSSTLLVDVPVTYAVMITPHNALSTRRRGSNRDGKNDPARSSGIRNSRSPAGVDYDADGIDIGIGVKPELTGTGEGYRFVAAVVAYALVTFSPLQLRVTIAAGNSRALRVWSAAAFTEVSRFATARDIIGSREFAMLTGAPTHHPRRNL